MIMTRPEASRAVDWGPRLCSFLFWSFLLYSILPRSFLLCSVLLLPSLLLLIVSNAVAAIPSHSICSSHSFTFHLRGSFLWCYLARCFLFDAPSPEPFPSMLLSAVLLSLTLLPQNSLIVCSFVAFPSFLPPAILNHASSPPSIDFVAFPHSMLCILY